MLTRVPYPRAISATLVGSACLIAHAAGAFPRRCDPFLVTGPPALHALPTRDSLHLAGPESVRRPPDSRVANDGALRVGAQTETWEPIEPLQLGSNASNMIIDADHDRLVLFGQNPAVAGNSNLVWVRSLSDDATPWSRLKVSGPHPARTISGTSIYDPVRKRLVEFGGSPGDGVWALSLSGTPAWTRLAFGDEGPGTVSGIVGIYDPIGDRLIIFGGSEGMNDVWAFALADDRGWTRLSIPGTRPGYRSNYAAVYDSNRRRMLMFSGFGDPDPDLWALSLGDSVAWTEIRAGGEHPPPMYQAGAAFDPIHDRMVVFEGVAPGYGVMDSTWVLQFGDSATWTRFAPEVRPVPRNSPSMVYDSDHDRFVVFGGGICDTWSLKLTPTPTWTLLEGEDLGPSYPYYLSAALYDPTRQRTLLFGGQRKLYDYGDFYTYPSDEPWEFTSDTFARWSYVQRDPEPPALTGMSLVLDPPGDRLITIGGFSGGDQPFGSPWQLKLDGASGWQRLYALGTLPPSRYLHSGIYDPVRRRVIVFGGRAGETALGDTWILDLEGRTRWTRLDSSATAPAARFGHSAVYDPIDDRIILFGGAPDENGVFGDTWQLKLAGTPTWSRLSLPTSPSRRCFAATAYDSRRQRLVLFGGRDSTGTPLRDTWFLPLAPGSSWIQGDSSGVLPRERWGAAAVYDPDKDRVVILNGTYDPCEIDLFLERWSAWAMHSSDPVPVPLALVRVQSHPFDVTLEWHAPDAADFAGSVERRTESGEWSLLGTVTRSAAGAVRFTDPTTSPGTRYAYRVRWSVGPSANTTEPVWVDAPELRFALSRPANPSLNGLVVAFSLPDGAAAKLEVIDISGRRIAARAVGELGAGDHELQIAPAGTLRAGRYLVRLTRGAESRVASVAVIR